MCAASVDKPIVGIPSCLKTVGERPNHTVQDKYIQALMDGTDCYPIIIPANGKEMCALLPILDGVLLTGSVSMVQPHHYGDQPLSEDLLFDPRRDSTTLPIIQTIVKQNIPLFAICRGMQELNVALGGSLFQNVLQLKDKLDHTDSTEGDDEKSYAPRHAITLTPGGYLEKLWQTETIMVNSLHQQGIERLAPGLVIEATAPDGVPEAVRVKDSPTFALGTQWHPEWKVKENPYSLKLFQAFNQAIWDHYKGRKAECAV